MKLETYDDLGEAMLKLILSLGFNAEEIVLCLENYFEPNCSLT